MAQKRQRRYRFERLALACSMPVLAHGTRRAISGLCPECAKRPPQQVLHRAQQFSLFNSSDPLGSPRRQGQGAISANPAPASHAVSAPCRIRGRRACRFGRPRAAPHRSRMRSRRRFSRQRRTAIAIAAHSRQPVVDEFCRDQIERQIVLGGEPRPVRRIGAAGAAGLAGAGRIGGWKATLHRFALAGNAGAGQPAAAPMPVR